MSEVAPEPPKSQRMALALLAILIGSTTYVFYGGRFDDSMAGWTALLVVPAALGGLIMQLNDPKGDQPLMGCIVWPTLGLLAVVGVSYLVLGEGAVCIAMILPLWIPAAIGGALVNRWNARRWRKFDRESAEFYSIAWLALPLLAAVCEFAGPPQWREGVVSREVMVPASPKELWPLLVSIPKIQPHEGRWNPTQDLVGIPRPSEALIVHQGSRIVRKARWGDEIRFEERITEWNTGKSLGWNFAFPDRSIQDHTDRHISPDGPMLRIISGRYELTEIGPGKTLVRLSTTYRMRTRLPIYLAWWGDRLLGDIQANVLAIIEHRASV